MTNKEPIRSLSAFALAQAQMGSAFKNAKNPFLKNKYADLTAIQNAVYPAFHANGFVIMQSPGKDEFGPFVETIFAHISGDRYSGRIYLEYKAGDMQSLGGAITYARRYGLASLSGVPVEDDDGNAATGRDRPKPAPAPSVLPATPIQRGVRLMRFIEKADFDGMEKIKTEAQQLIEEVRGVDQEFAARIEISWDNRKLELGEL